MKKTISLLLAFVLAAVFVACATNNINPGDTIANTAPNGTATDSPAVTNASVTSEEPQNVETSRKQHGDNLPDDLYYDGATFLVHYNDQNKSEWFVEDTTEKLNAAIYYRNEKVMNRLGVVIETYNAGPLNTYPSIAIPALQATIASGEGQYSLIAGYQAYITRAGMVDFLYDISDANYLDYDMPWWNSDAREKMTINNKLFYLTGDLALTYFQNMSIILFNAQIAEERVSTDLYETALNGDWTMELFKKSIIEGKADLNGDTVIDDVNDQIGLTMFDRGSGILPFLAAFREYYISQDESGSFYLDVDVNRMQKITETVCDLVWNTEGSVFPAKGYPTAKENGLAKIANNTCLFMIERLYAVEQPVIRGMTTEWGVLPIPKLDDTQKDYGVWLMDAYSMFCFPSDVKNIDMACAVTEALAAESYRNVTDTYYETCLRSKYMHSDNAMEVVDMLRPCIQINFGYIYTKTGPLPGFVNDLVIKNNPNFVSWFDANRGSMEGQLKDLLEQYY